MTYNHMLKFYAALKKNSYKFIYAAILHLKGYSLRVERSYRDTNGKLNK